MRSVGRGYPVRIVRIVRIMRIMRIVRIVRIVKIVWRWTSSRVAGVLLLMLLRVLLSQML